jgi:excisionase family DNA binding protein
MSEILTAEEVATMLKISKRQVYELAKQTDNPIPAVRIRTSVRFRRSDVDGWVAGLVENHRGQ